MTTDPMTQQALPLRAEGRTVQYIAWACGMTQTAVKKLLHDTLGERPGKGRGKQHA